MLLVLLKYWKLMQTILMACLCMMLLILSFPALLLRKILMVIFSFLSTLILYLFCILCDQLLSMHITLSITYFPSIDIIVLSVQKRICLWNDDVYFLNE